MSPAGTVFDDAIADVPRSAAIASGWARLRDVGPFTGTAGLPLARTVKLVIDPLVLRPVRNPRLAQALLTREAAAEVARLITEAGPDLAAAARWFEMLKRARRRAGITEGNPQELYFQRAYELARTIGAPDDARSADAAVAEVLSDIHDGSRLTFAAIRAYATEPRAAADLRQRLAEAAASAGARRDPDASAADEGRERRELLHRLLDRCAGSGEAAAATGADEIFAELVGASAGIAAAPELRTDGTARRLGLSAHDSVAPLAIGENASKTDLPAPLDRTVLERLLASLAALADSGLDAAAAVETEISRAVGGWRLAEESSHVVLAAAEVATTVFDSGPGLTAVTDAGARLAARWRREPFVHRALRLGDAEAEIGELRESIMRRLWVRLHGRELREEPVAADAVWQLVEGALRSVILDRRDRVKSALARGPRQTTGVAA